jgi:cation transporter-like permease
VIAPDAETRRYPMNDNKNGCQIMDTEALKRTFSRRESLRAFRVALVVGTILNVINQGASILATGEVDILRGTLTYMVPFFVASYGAYGAYSGGNRNER